MPDFNAPTLKPTNRFRAIFDEQDSNRQKEMAAAAEKGEVYDGLTNRDVAMMLNGNYLAIIGLMMYRGALTVSLEEVSDIAHYVAGTAMSADARRIVDGIAEGELDVETRGNMAGMAFGKGKEGADTRDTERWRAQKAENDEFMMDLSRFSDKPAAKS